MMTGEKWHTTWHDSPQSDCQTSSFRVNAFYLTLMDIKPLEVNGVMGSTSTAG